MEGEADGVYMQGRDCKVLFKGFKISFLYRIVIFFTDKLQINYIFVVYCIDTRNIVLILWI